MFLPLTTEGANLFVSTSKKWSSHPLPPFYSPPTATVTFDDDGAQGESPLRSLPLARGSQVTTIEEPLLCGAIVAGGFGSPLLTGRQTHANITDAVHVATLCHTVCPGRSLPPTTPT